MIIITHYHENVSVAAHYLFAVIRYKLTLTNWQKENVKQNADNKDTLDLR